MQNIIAIVLLVVSVVFILRKVFKPAGKSNCGEGCSCK